jgi:undecaprenyl diphosphate synthase
MGHTNGTNGNGWLRSGPLQLVNGMRIPRHLAIIMDGNGRWARGRFLPRIEGHRAGAKTVRMVVEESRRLGVQYLTLFTFSTENWQRPPEEVSSLMLLFRQYLASELKTLAANGIRLRALGDLGKLSPATQDALRRAEEATAHLDGMELLLAISYGGREELVSMARRIAEEVKAGVLDPAAVDESVVRGRLYAPDVPDPDLLIRTSDENRISNFLLWQLAYSEIVVSPQFWPGFSKEEYHRCLREFSGRKRRFGLTDEQLDAVQVNGGAS